MTSALAVTNSDPIFVMPSLPSVNEIEAVMLLAKYAHQSGMTKAANPHAAFFIAMYGRELGISPITALRTIYIVNGVPVCSGEALLALVRKSGKVKITLPDPSTITNAATITIERLDSKEKQSFSFTEEMAKDAGLLGKTNWKLYKRQMYIWRAVSIGVKMMCSDIVGGMYTVEEINPDIEVDEGGEPLSNIIDADFTHVNGNGKSKNNPTEWATKDELRNVYAYVMEQTGTKPSIEAFVKLAGMDALDDYEAWNKKYANRKIAADTIIEAIKKSQQPSDAQTEIDLDDEFGLKALEKLPWPTEATLNKAYAKAKELCGTELSWSEFCELAEIEDVGMEDLTEWGSYKTASDLVEAVVDAMEEKLQDTGEEKPAASNSLGDVSHRLEMAFGKNADFFLNAMGKSLKDFVNKLDTLFEAARAHVIAKTLPVVAHEMTYTVAGKRSFTTYHTAVGDIRMYGSTDKLAALGDEFVGELTRAKENQGQKTKIYNPVLITWEQKNSYRSVTGLEKFDIPF